MAVTTILVDKDQNQIDQWKDYVTRYDRETCKTAADDLSGLGTPKPALKETLEEVLDLMGQAQGGVALIYAHANATGLIMRIADQANSAQSVFIRGISRAWKAVFEMIQLRSGKWPKPGETGSPEFLIDLPKAKELFKNLVEELGKIPGGFESRMTNPEQVTNRAEADAWFDKWMDMMAKACLAPGLTQTDLRRVCRAMQKVRDAKFDRVELRACNIGKARENLNAFKEFFGVSKVTAPTVTMFFGKQEVDLNPGGNLDTLAQQMGGFRGTTFTAPTNANHPFNRVPSGEAAVTTGRRNRIFPGPRPSDAIFQVTEIAPFKFKSRIKSTTTAAATRFVQANYKTGGAVQGGPPGLPIGGMWAPKTPGISVPFVLPMEAGYRDLLETSN
jgi:hypothetical protein